MWTTDETRKILFNLFGIEIEKPSKEEELEDLKEYIKEKKQKKDKIYKELEELDLKIEELLDLEKQLINKI